MERLFFVTLRNRAGDVMAGGHYLARDAAHARAIGQTDLCRVPTAAELGGGEHAERMAESIRAKVAGWHCVRAVPSTASRSNALNAK
jgi:hypothetical protein